MLIPFRAVFASPFLRSIVSFKWIVTIALVTLITMNTKAMSKNSSELKLNFADPAEIQNWIIVNDTVMGGRSNARLGIENNRLHFSGDLSLENNGGFASTRRVGNPKNWSSQVDITLKLKGDGRQYQFRLRTNKSWDGVAYVAGFNTDSTDQTITFSASDFTPQWRGQLVTNAPDLDFADIQQIGFMLADKQPGKFQIEIESISQ